MKGVKIAHRELGNVNETLLGCSKIDEGSECGDVCLR